MRTVKCFLLALTTLAVMAALTFSSPALADCGKKSKKMFMSPMSDMQDTKMSGDMPMCCRMKMDHSTMKEDKTTSEAENYEGANEMPGMTGEKEEQAGKKQSKEVKDPVCSMTVDPQTAEKSVYKGKTYYFCSKDDKNAFEKSPDKYVKEQKSEKRPQ